MADARNRITALPDTKTLEIVGIDWKIEPNVTVLREPTTRLSVLVLAGAEKLNLPVKTWEQMRVASSEFFEMVKKHPAKLPSAILAKIFAGEKQLMNLIQGWDELTCEAVYSALRWVYRHPEAVNAGEWWKPAIRAFDNDLENV